MPRVYCQAEGCTHPLPKTPYHKRYRICGFHAGLPLIQIDGALQRFCQQCGRFQALAEFDGTKKSCRRKLVLHNAQRRRKRARQHRHPPTPGLVKEKKGQKQIAPGSSVDSPTVSDQYVTPTTSKPDTSPDTAQLPASSVCHAAMPPPPPPEDSFPIGMAAEPGQNHDAFDIDALLNSLETEAQNIQAAAYKPAMQLVNAPIMTASRAPPSPATMAAPQPQLASMGPLWSLNVSSYLDPTTCAALPRSLSSENAVPQVGAQQMPQIPVTAENIWMASYRLFKAPPSELPPDVLSALMAMLRSQV